jgi:hypothetical protein
MKDMVPAGRATDCRRFAKQSFAAWVAKLELRDQGLRGARGL